MSSETRELSVPKCLNDPRDRSRLAHAPLVPMPTFGTLPSPPLGGRQYVGAADGIYVQARHHGLAVTARLSTILMPYGPMEPSFHLPGGLIPADLVQEMRNAAVAACPLEWVGVVQWQEQASHYQLIFPRIISRSHGDISYETDAIDPQRVVCIVHSHGLYPAFFSPQDDATDRAGLYVAVVIGPCGSASTMTYCARLVVEEHHFALRRPPWLTRQEHATQKMPLQTHLEREFL